MYYHFPVENEFEVIDKPEAIKRMDAIYEQWEEESSDCGRVILPVFNWAFRNEGGIFEILKPELVEGGEIPKNEKASAFLKDDIYGDCFVEPRNKQEEDLLKEYIAHTYD